MNPGERKPWSGGQYKPKPMASPADFFAARTRPSTHESEELALSCIYAHYRTWAYLSGKQAVALAKFEAALAKSCATPPFDHHGHRIYARWVLDPKPREASSEEDASPVRAAPKVLGRVRTVERLHFLDSTCAIGIELPWMEPTDGERRSLEQNARSSFDPAKSHLVIFWDARRRIIPGTAVERIE